MLFSTVHIAIYTSRVYMCKDYVADRYYQPSIVTLTGPSPAAIIVLNASHKGIVLKLLAEFLYGVS